MIFADIIETVEQEGSKDPRIPNEKNLSLLGKVEMLGQSFINDIFRNIVLQTAARFGIDAETWRYVQYGGDELYSIRNDVIRDGNNNPHEYGTEFHCVGSMSMAMDNRILIDGGDERTQEFYAPILRNAGYGTPQESLKQMLSKKEARAFFNGLNEQFWEINDPESAEEAKLEEADNTDRHSFIQYSQNYRHGKSVGQQYAGNIRKFHPKFFAYLAICIAIDVGRQSSDRYRVMATFSTSKLPHSEQKDWPFEIAVSPDDTPKIVGEKLLTALGAAPAPSPSEEAAISENETSWLRMS